jgi:hypothetical protein
MAQRIALDGKALWRGISRGRGGQRHFGQGYVGSSRGSSRSLHYRTHRSIPSMHTRPVHGLGGYGYSVQPNL